MTSKLACEYLAFSIAEQEFCMDILNVQEIRRYSAVTRLPNAPLDVPGVINLRGLIVPLVDLRVRFGVATPTYDGTTVVIVVMIGAVTVGIVADGVSDVIRLDADAVKQPPGLKFIRDCAIVGMANIAERMLTVLDINTMLAPESQSLSELADPTLLPETALSA